MSFPGEHAAIIDRKVWDKVQAQFRVNPRKRSATARSQTPSLLKGLIFGPTGVAMSPSHTRKKGRLYRYYVSQTVLKQAATDCPIGRVPAAEIEKIVIDQVRTLLRSPEIIVQTWRRARKSSKTLTETDVRNALLSSISSGTSCFQQNRRGSFSFLSSGSMLEPTASISGCGLTVSHRLSASWSATAQRSGMPHDRSLPSARKIASAMTAKP